MAGKSFMTKSFKWLWLILLASCIIIFCYPQKQVIYRDKKSDFNIIIKAQPADLEKSAAAELQDHLKQTGGVEIPIKGDNEQATAHEIIVGRNAHLPALNVNEDWPKLGKDGYIIRTVGSKLVIAGNTEQGTLNGVYAFLEEIVGIRWLTPEVTHVPELKELSLKPLNIRYIPPFGYRQIINVNTVGGAGQKWAARHRINQGSNIQPHTIFRLFCAGLTSPDGTTPSIEAVFKEHPEYFSELKGKRTFEMAQLCLTNPDIPKILTAGIKRQIGPGTASVHLSSMDGGRPCRCAACEKAYRQMGSISTVFFDLINKVAKTVAEEYPEVTIETIAYHFTQPPPLNMKMGRNVRVVYAPIRMNYYYALDEGKHNTEGGLISECPPSVTQVPQQLRKWKAIAEHICFMYQPLKLPVFHPNPNLRPLSKSFRLMKDLGVEGIYVEEVNWVKEHDLNHLRAYLLAQLMWNPDYDTQKGTEEFCRLYYGPAYKEVLEYLALVHSGNSWDWQEWKQGRRSAWDYREPGSCWNWFNEKPGPAYYKERYMLLSWQNNPPLKEVYFNKAKEIFTAALKTVEGNKDFEERIRILRQPMYYAALLYLPGDHPIFKEAYQEYLPFVDKLVKEDPKLGKRMELVLPEDIREMAEEKKNAAETGAKPVKLTELKPVLKLEFDDDIAGDGALITNKAGGVNGQCLSRQKAWSAADRVAGAEGYAFAFGGNEDKRFIQIPFSENLNFGTNDFSISFWIKTTQKEPNVGIIVKTTSPPYWLVAMDNGSLVFHIKDAMSRETSVGGAGNISDGAWHHVALTADRDKNGVIYIDGQRDATFSISNNQGSLARNTTLNIGAGFINYFDGVLDSLCLYNRSLTAGEVRALYGK